MSGNLDPRLKSKWKSTDYHRTHSRNGLSHGTMLLMELKLATMSVDILVMAAASLAGLLVDSASMILGCSMSFSDMMILIDVS